MKEVKEIMKEFTIVYGPIIAAMLAFAGAAAMGGHENGAGACAGIATIAAIMYVITVILSAAIELVNFVKGERK